MLLSDPEYPLHDLGSVRHALSNGSIETTQDLVRWTAKDLTRRLGVRPHELRRIEACLQGRGLSLASEE